MKQKSMKRLLSIVLAGAMAVGTLTACGSKPVEQQESKQESKQESEQESKQEVSASAVVSEAEDEGITYPIEGDVTLTLAIVQEANVTSGGAKDLFETPFGKAWQENTGVNIEVLQLADNNAMNLLFAGGEIPDLVWFGFQGSYSGGAAKAIKDKVVEPLNDYVEYLPDMMAALESNPDFLKATTTDDGDIIGGPFVRADEKLKTSSGMMIRQDFLDEVNMEIPKTPDELYTVLKAFKDELKVESPLSARLWWLQSIGLNHGLFTSPFGLVKANLYQENGEVRWGYYEQEYKEVLAWLNKLYTEGLMDPNFATIDNATHNANFMNGISGMTISSNGGISTFINTMKEADPDFNVSGVGPLVAKEGDVALSTHYDNAVTGFYLTMSPTCKDKEAAAKFINYGYTEEGQMLMNFGIEGESYTMVDGYPTYTDVIMKNPDGLNISQAMAQYQRAWSNGPFLQKEEYVEQYYVLEQQKQALDVWSVSDAIKYQLPAVVIAEEDAAGLSKLKADIDVYIGEMLVKFVTGQVSLDAFETEYLPTLKKMGIETVISMYQRALDNYNAR